MSGPVIHLRDIHFAYETGRPVLDGVTLALEPGQRLGLTGPNGSGKSSLLQLIVGLLRPQSGEVEVMGKPCETEADFTEVRRTAGLLFQDSDDQLFCPTVLEDVAFGPLNLGKSPDEAVATASETLSRLGLAGFEERVTYRLSGGEKRLVALAGVLAMEPRVLLLDEPSAGLDDDAEERLAAILAGLEQEMLVVSHNRAFLERVTGGIVTMGEIASARGE